MRIDVLLEKRARWRRLVDVDLIHVDVVIVQETPGILAGRSGRLRIEGGLRHATYFIRTSDPGRSHPAPCTPHPAHPAPRAPTKPCASVKIVVWDPSADRQRDLPLDPGGVHPRRAALRVRAPDGVRSQVLVVRHALRLFRRTQDGR